MSGPEHAAAWGRMDPEDLTRRDEQRGGTEVARTTSADWERKATGALRRYRVMAWVTGVMLLVLVVEMTIKYAVRPGEDVLRWIEWIPFAHGWIYVVYLVTVLDLWSTMRWRFGRLAAMVLAGVVPVLSFVVERRVHADGDARLAEGRPAPVRTPR